MNNSTKIQLIETDALDWLTANTNGAFDLGII